MKNARELEKIFKGCANRSRIEILLLLQRRSERSVFEINDALQGDFRTISEHIRKLVHAGLVLKRKTGKEVLHTLTLRAQNILSFCRMLE